jgi:hypothetical protein
MSNVTNEPQNNGTPCRSAAETGLASLLLGGILALMAMLTLQINLQMYFSPRVWPLNDVRPIFYAAILSSIVLAGITGTSIAFGIRGLMIAYKNRLPAALGWAGLLISGLALFLWIGALVDLFSVLEMLRRR